MSTAAVSSSSLNQQLQQYFQTRRSDLKQLGEALASGDLAGAQTAYNSIATLGQSGPFASGNPFLVHQREQDFTNIGQALQSGDVAGAQQAFTALRNTFERRVQDPAPVNPTNTNSSGGPEIVLNISNSAGTSASPEQITINISNPASGGEQVSLSIGSQGSSPEQITFNLPSNSNEQIVLNLLNAPATSGSSGSTPSGTSAGGGLSVSA